VTSAFKQLREQFDKHLEFSETELEKILACFHVKHLRKKDFFLEAGKTPRYEAFITKGLVKQYVLDLDGKERTIYFAVEDWWVSDINAFLNQQPATMYIRALEDSELLVISKSDKLKLYKEVPLMDRLFRVMTQKSHAALQERMIDNLTKTADQRYLDYITKYPHIASRLNNLQIASYLGVSHEFLSKIKKRHM